MQSTRLLASIASAMVASLRSDIALGFSYPLAGIEHRNCRLPTVVLFDHPGSGNGEAAEPSYFQMRQIPTATSGEKLDHIIGCSENGECDIEEMMDMIDELEELNAQCQGATSRECNLDAVAARNVLKVALASRVAVENAMSREEVDCASSIPSAGRKASDIDDPYAFLAEMEDECPPDAVSLRIPSETTARLDRIVWCAEGTLGICDAEEMLEMVEELEKLNMECEGALSRECSVDAVTARNILKVALASKAVSGSSISV